MLDLALVLRRLSQYGGVWLIAFVLPLAVGLVGLFGFERRAVEMADLVLPPAFVVLAAVLLAFAVVTVVAKESLLTKAVLLVLGMLLALPLLWSPVLAAVATAWAAGQAIEYSDVYREFRIVVGTLLYELTETVFGSPMLDAAWRFMEIFAGVVGFFAAVVRSWMFIQAISEKPGDAGYASRRMASDSDPSDLL